MTLAGEIESLRSRVVADLNAAHDYYSHAKTAWEMIQTFVDSGQQFIISNTATGTAIDQSKFIDLSRDYVSVQLTEATFQQFLSIFEDFLLQLLRLWLRAYPQIIENKELKFKEILSAPDKDAIIDLAIHKELSGLLYQRPREWFAYLKEKTKLASPAGDEIDRFAEAKASRDALVHNRGVVNEVYLSKAGKFSRFQTGDRIVLDEPYHRATWELTKNMAAAIADEAAAKLNRSRG